MTHPLEPLRALVNRKAAKLTHEEIDAFFSERAQRKASEQPEQSDACLDSADPSPPAEGGSPPES